MLVKPRNWKWLSAGRAMLGACTGCAWLLTLSLPAAGQYRFDHWTADNGVPHDYV